MNAKTSLGLVVAAALVWGLAWLMGATGERGAASASLHAGSLAFPDLTPRLKDVARIELVHGGQTAVIIERHGDRWGITDRSGYPVLPAKLREMLTSLTELRLVEPRTADPAEYGRVGVEDMITPGAASNLLRLLDGQGKPILELLVGRRRIRTQGAAMPGDAADEIYVRRPGEAQSWLASGRLVADADPALWLDRDVMNIAHSRIASLEVTHAGDQAEDGALRFSREGSGADAKLILTEPALHPAIDEFRLDDVWRGLESLTFEEVIKTNDAPGKPLGTARFKTEDGLTVDITAFSDSDKIWARFKVNGEGKAEAEAAAVRERIDGWTYRLPGYRAKTLVPAFADLKAAEKGPPSPDAGAGPAAPSAPGQAAPVNLPPTDTGLSKP